MSNNAQQYKHRSILAQRCNVTKRDRAETEKEVTGFNNSRQPSRQRIWRSNDVAT